MWPVPLFLENSLFCQFLVLLGTKINFIVYWWKLVHYVCGYSSVVEHSTAYREVPGSNPCVSDLIFFNSVSHDKGWSPKYFLILFHMIRDDRQNMVNFTYKVSQWMNEIIYWKAKNIYRSHKRPFKQKLSEPALIDQIQHTFCRV